MTAPTASRPIGVAIISILIGLYGLLLILGGILVAALGTTTLKNGLGVGFFGESGIILGVIVLIFGLIVLGLAVGLWHLRQWALALMLIVLIVFIILDVLSHTILSLGFFIDIILFVYLLAVSRHFS